jgi:hypothetical protein
MANDPSSNVATPQARLLQALAAEVRGKTLRLLGAARDDELTWAPAGTSNHILWHAGHGLWLQDALCIRRVTGHSELPPGWAEAFGMGSRPALRREPWPPRDVVLGLLREQLSRLMAVLGGLTDADLDALPPFAAGRDRRRLGACVLHGLHDEANHQGEMYLLLKAQRRRRGRTE